MKIVNYTIHPTGSGFGTMARFKKFNYIFGGPMDDENLKKVINKLVSEFSLNYGKKPEESPDQVEGQPMTTETFVKLMAAGMERLRHDTHMETITVMHDHLRDCHSDKGKSPKNDKKLMFFACEDCDNVACENHPKHVASPSNDEDEDKKEARIERDRLVEVSDLLDGIIDGIAEASKIIELVCDREDSSPYLWKNLEDAKSIFERNLKSLNTYIENLDD